MRNKMQSTDQHFLKHKQRLDTKETVKRNKLDYPSFEIGEVDRISRVTVGRPAISVSPALPPTRESISKHRAFTYLQQQFAHSNRPSKKQLRLPNDPVFAQKHLN